MDMRRIFRITAGVVAFLAAFEATVRLEDLVRYGTPMLADARSQSDLITADSLGIRGRPHGRFRQWALDSLGFRGPEVTRTPPPGTIRVVTLGASETFGLMESPGKEFPRQLEDSLNALARQVFGRCKDTPRYEVVNAALPGMYLPTAVRYVRGHLSSLAPDAILYYPTPHQYLDVVPPTAYEGGPLSDPTRSSDRWLYPRSWGRVRETIKSLLPAAIDRAVRKIEIARIAGAHNDEWVFSSIPSDRAEQLEWDLRELITAARSIGAIPVLMTHANAFQAKDTIASAALLLKWRRYAVRAPGEVILGFDSVANDRIRLVAADSNVPLVRTDSALEASYSRGNFADYVHFNDAGASQVAKATAIVVSASLGACESDLGSPVTQ